jgi:hypothetical protein
VGGYQTLTESDDSSDARQRVREQWSYVVQELEEINIDVANVMSGALESYALLHSSKVQPTSYLKILLLLLFV